MGCSCIEPFWDADPVTLIEEKWVKARKDHKCIECDRVIKAGENYYLEKYPEEDQGTIKIVRTCDVCIELRNKLFCRGFCYGFLWVDLREAIVCGWEPTDECIEGLSEKAEGKLIEFYDGVLDGMDPDLVEVI